MKIKRQKYGAQRTEVDGVMFHSKKEAARYRELLLRQRAGEIRGLRLQPKFELEAARALRTRVVGIYRADFAYDERIRLEAACGRALAGDNGYVWKPVIEDVKGFRTPLYKWKKRHVEAQYGIEIREI